MEEQQLQAFVDSVVNYFQLNPGNAVRVGTPYLMEASKEITSDVSGMIAISGSRSGWVCYTAPRIMVKHLLLTLGESDTSSTNVMDMVGEVANTISGNLRKHFGSQFLISVPNVFEGRQLDSANTAAEDNRCYVVPIYWKQYHSSMVVYLH